MDQELISEFEDGVNAYWGGQEPKGWQSAKKRAESPFLTGWFWAAELEVGCNSVRDQHGEYMNPDVDL
jgi:hypothetical protein